MPGRYSFPLEGLKYTFVLLSWAQVVFKIDEAKPRLVPLVERI